MERCINTLKCKIKASHDLCTEDRGGTTAKVCHDLRRRFITGDISPGACRVIIDRIKEAGCSNFAVKQPPKTRREWQDFTNGHKFAETICEFTGWECNSKKSNDGGIDSWAKTKTGQRVPIQIKNQKKSIGRDVIQKFVGALNKYDKSNFCCLEL